MKLINKTTLRLWWLDKELTELKKIYWIKSNNKLIRHLLQLEYLRHFNIE